MSQYAVLYAEKSKTFTLKDEDPAKPNAKAFSHIRADQLGELSEATVHPQPAEHLKNLASNLGFDIKFFNIKNETSNERLDVLNQDAAEIEDADRTIEVHGGEGGAEPEMRAPTEL